MVAALSQAQGWREFAIRESPRVLRFARSIHPNAMNWNKSMKAVLAQLPPFEREASKSKSDKFIFKTLAERDQQSSLGSEQRAVPSGAHAGTVPFDRKP